MTETLSWPRALDHCVLPTAGLKAARTRLTALGFTVAPDGKHPFGTVNCCVYLADGTFLEPLAVANRDKVAEAIEASNVFVTRDWAFRFRRNEEGFSALVFGSDDAAADHQRFVTAGWSAGPMLEFSRLAKDAAGKSGKASFRIAFAGDARAPDCLIFTCQRVDVPNIDRSSLQRHENGATRIRSVILAAPRVEFFGPFVRAASGAEIATTTRWDSFVFQAANCTIELMHNNRLRENFGPLSSGDQGLEARVVVFGVDDLRATKAYLLSRRIECEKFRGRVIVQPAPGQGAIFAFEENT